MHENYAEKPQYRYGLFQTDWNATAASIPKWFVFLTEYVGRESFCEGFHQIIHGFNWIVNQPLWLNEHEYLENHNDMVL